MRLTDDGDNEDNEDSADASARRGAAEAEAEAEALRDNADVARRRADIVTLTKGRWASAGAR